MGEKVILKYVKSNPVIRKFIEDDRNFNKEVYTKLQTTFSLTFISDRCEYIKWYLITIILPHFMAQGSLL